MPSASLSVRTPSVPKNVLVLNIISSENQFVVPPLGKGVWCRGMDLCQTFPPKGGTTNRSTQIHDHSDHVDAEGRVELHHHQDFAPDLHGAIRRDRQLVSGQELASEQVGEKAVQSRAQVLSHPLVVQLADVLIGPYPCALFDVIDDAPQRDLFGRLVVGGDALDDAYAALLLQREHAVLHKRFHLAVVVFGGERVDARQRLVGQADVRREGAELSGDGGGRVVWRKLRHLPGNWILLFQPRSHKNDAFVRDVVRVLQNLFDLARIRADHRYALVSEVFGLFDVAQDVRFDLRKGAARDDDDLDIAINQVFQRGLKTLSRDRAVSAAREDFKPRRGFRQSVRFRLDHLDQLRRIGFATQPLRQVRDARDQIDLLQVPLSQSDFSYAGLRREVTRANLGLRRRLRGEGQRAGRRVDLDHLRRRGRLFQLILRRQPVITHRHASEHWIGRLAIAIAVGLRRENLFGGDLEGAVAARHQFNVDVLLRLAFLDAYLQAVASCARRPGPERYELGVVVADERIGRGPGRLFVDDALRVDRPGAVVEENFEGPHETQTVVDGVRVPLARLAEPGAPFLVTVQVLHAGPPHLSGSDDPDVAGGDGANRQQPFCADLDVSAGQNHFGNGFSHMFILSVRLSNRERFDNLVVHLDIDLFDGDAAAQLAAVFGLERESVFELLFPHRYGRADGRIDPKMLSRAETERMKLQEPFLSEQRPTRSQNILEVPRYSIRLIETVRPYLQRH